MSRLLHTALVAALAAGAPLAFPPPSVAAESATAYYVSPSGSDSNAGTSASAPLATIQKAVDLAPTGAVVNLAAGAADECLRVRYLVTGADIFGNTITNCGVADFKFGGGGKNGEGIYLGTAPEQQGANGAPDAAPDISKNNRIHHNTIATQGNECVDVKENSTNNYVEYNDCSGQKDAGSRGLDARGSGNIFRYNTIHDNVGAGIRLGGDTATDGIGTSIYGNTITDNAGGGIKFMRTPQGPVCTNTMSGNTGGYAVGTYGSEYTPTGACPQ
ncbi:right-handed parallel beta-helix repeat-containing protein [Streptomyces sp. NPDC005181]|uniref:right-handed parallel beta-helix repeat-containing protein n=1 Tax=Streptomyces sp. NPDC005181 TaxID=3156869 RepID=UPI0033B0D6EE